MYYLIVSIPDLCLLPYSVFNKYWYKHRHYIYGLHLWFMRRPWHLTINITRGTTVCSSKQQQKTQTLPEMENSDSRIMLESCHFTRIARSKRLVYCCLKMGFDWQFQRHLPLSIHSRIPRTKTKNLRRTRPIMADFVYFSTPEPNLHKLLTIYL